METLLTIIEQPRDTSLILKSYKKNKIDIMQNAQEILDKEQRMQLFRQEFQEYNQECTTIGIEQAKKEDWYPCLYDRTAETGFDRHYVYHPAWAARKIAEHSPRKHIDISSTLHFSTILSAFIPVEFYDYRPAKLIMSQLSSASADLTALPFDSSSIESLSCMHVIEHIGLGRYGDPLDPSGDKKAAQELSRVLATDGKLLIALPVGKPRIQFNAHRVYSHQEVIKLFSELKLDDWALIPDGEVEHGMIHQADIATIEEQMYGCGCYVFTKR